MLELTMFLVNILQLVMFTFLCFFIPVDVERDGMTFPIVATVFGVFSIFLIILLGFIAIFAA